jgi:hypothetical protein
MASRKPESFIGAGATSGTGADQGIATTFPGAVPRPTGSNTGPLSGIYWV